MKNLERKPSRISFRNILISEPTVMAFCAQQDPEKATLHQYKIRHHNLTNLHKPTSQSSEAKASTSQGASTSQAASTSQIAKITTETIEETSTTRNTGSITVSLSCKGGYFTRDCLKNYFLTITGPSETTFNKKTSKASTEYKP